MNIMNGIRGVFRGLSIRRFSVDIYMKSGNVIHLKDVVTFKVNAKDNTVSHLSWEFFVRFRNKQMIYIDLGQIECVTSREQ